MLAVVKAGTGASRVFGHWMALESEAEHWILGRGGGY